jgi:hypothetical protein
MTHLALLQADDEGNVADWGDHVTTRSTEPHPRSTARRA